MPAITICTNENVTNYIRIVNGVSETRSAWAKYISRVEAAKNSAQRIGKLLQVRNNYYDNE